MGRGKLEDRVGSIEKALEDCSQAMKQVPVIQAALAEFMDPPARSIDTRVKVGGQTLSQWRLKLSQPSSTL